MFEPNPKPAHRQAAAPYWRALLLLMLLAITWLALTPEPPQAADTGWDKANHLLAFASLALVAGLSFAARPLTLGLSLLAYGGLIEVLQSCTPSRVGEWSDLLADGLGIALGLLMGRLLKAFGPWRARGEPGGKGPCRG